MSEQLPLIHNEKIIECGSKEEAVELVKESMGQFRAPQKPDLKPIIHELYNALEHNNIVRKRLLEALYGFESELPTAVSQDLAQLISMSRERFSSQAPEFQFLEQVKNKVMKQMAVPKELLGIDYSKHEKRIFAIMLKEAGLGEWFDELQRTVEQLRPDNDLLTFKKQVEELLNDDRVLPFRTQDS